MQTVEGDCVAQIVNLQRFTLKLLAAAAELRLNLTEDTFETLSPPLPFLITINPLTHDNH